MKTSRRFQGSRVSPAGLTGDKNLKKEITTTVVHYVPQNSSFLAIIQAEPRKLR